MLASYILVLVGGAVVRLEQVLFDTRNCHTWPCPARLATRWDSVSSVLRLQVGTTMPTCFYLDSGARTWVFVLAKPVLYRMTYFPCLLLILNLGKLSSVQLAGLALPPSPALLFCVTGDEDHTQHLMHLGKCSAFELQHPWLLVALLPSYCYTAFISEVTCCFFLCHIHTAHYSSLIMTYRYFK